MIGVDEALATILAEFAPLPVADVPILEAVGQVLAEDQASPLDVPPLANAAMDGYAVRAADLDRATESEPSRLRVVEDLPAGRCAIHLVEPGTAIRIMTGAPLPGGADAVVQFELTDEARGAQRGQHVAVYGPIRPGVNVRQAGEDLRRGDVLLTRGTVLRPAEVGVLATMGQSSTRVHARPRIGILSTGDELLAPGEPWAPGKIYDANSYSLAAMVQQMGGIPVRLGVARDRLDELLERVAEASDVDLLVTSAGVSVGDYDVVKQALSRAGRITFYQVRMRPGRPLAFGRLGGTAVLGLPGNPVACAISFELFGRPILMRMLGNVRWRRAELPARFDGELDNYDGRRSYYRVVVGREDGALVARLTGPQGSGIISSLARANALMVVPEEVRRLGSGDRVSVWSLGADELGPQHADIR